MVGSDWNGLALHLLAPDCDGLDQPEENAFDDQPDNDDHRQAGKNLVREKFIAVAEVSKPSPPFEELTPKTPRIRSFPIS